MRVFPLKISGPFPPEFFPDKVNFEDVDKFLTQ